MGIFFEAIRDLHSGYLATQSIDYHQALWSADNNRILSAPVKRPLRILDIGTGSGVMAGENAQRFPDAHVIGMDVLSEQQAGLPHNGEFRIGNIEETPWEFANETFDYIYAGNLAGYIRNDKWDLIYAEALRCLKPAGYLAHSEVDILSTEPPWDRYQKTCLIGCFWGGRSVALMKQLRMRFIFAGVDNIKERELKLSGSDVQADVANRVACLQSIFSQPQLLLELDLIPKFHELFDSCFALREKRLRPTHYYLRAEAVKGTFRSERSIGR
ncbi:Methyltransferase type 11 [Beauveria bassiana ARSEF 2860]|uniref:Methyltransferase type 11 n=1 Tax=Beauveria bassiana (strain ARSEF 2860) TaxID=655819 RepID=J4VSM2_BEAB2|nr:Methyltransferase type 11 [Beauveria bassiana ARSEF 2860]EJP61595.1 Methyltransferase type 11 [Beauveria bassiana ARSEF 2860]